MLAWEWAAELQIQIPKSGIYLSFDGLDYCVPLVVAQAVTLNIWFLNM